MNWKQFLKPNWRKILIFVILIFLSSFFIWNFLPVEWMGIGFPIPFYEMQWGAPAFGISQQPVETSINSIGLIADIIFWYLMSCLIVWFYDKFRKKSI